MKNLYIKLGILTSCACMIIASGDAPGGTGNAAYELFNSTAAKASTLNGSAIQTNAKTGELKLLTVSGTLQHDSGSSQIENGENTIADTNGPDANGILSDGSSTLKYSGNFKGDYKYVATYRQNYKVGDLAHDTTGIVGIATLANDMPKSTTSTYNGEAEAIVITSVGGFDLNEGSSKVVANFSTNKVTVTLNDFTAINQNTGKASSAPIDEIKISNMSLSGSGFSGGTFSTTKAGAAVNITGANNSNAARGSFFGINAGNTAPAEVGGHVLMQGDGGVVMGTFIAK